MFRCSPSNTITRQRVQRLAQTTLRIEARVRHRHCADYQSMSTKSFNLESQTLEVFAIGVERFPFGRPKVKRQRQEQSLGGCCPTLKGVHELLVKDSLVRGMLIDQNQAVLVLECDVRSPQLNEGGNGLRGSCNSRGGNCAFVFGVAVNCCDRVFGE